MTDLAIAATLTAVSFLPLGIPALELSYLPNRAGPVLTVVLTLAQTIPIAARSRMPAMTLLIVGIGFACSQLLGADTGLAGLGLLMALYSVGRYSPDRQLWLAAAALFGYVILAVVLAGAGSPERMIDWVTFGAVLAAPWVAGTLVRIRVDRQRELEAAAAARAVSDARAAIAQDLHDVVTHHVTAMMIQAESTLFATEHLDTDDRSTALSTIGATGRSALRELRSLLDALDPVATGEDRHGLAGADIGTLIRRLQETGYPVTFQQDPDLRLDPPESATLHDVAREALTNAMRHAPGASVDCTVRELAHGVELVVSNRMPSATPVDPGGGGRGSAIMAERMREAGGTLQLTVEDGRFVVTARIPR